MRYASTLLVKTSEGISFSLPLAGPLVRFLAWGVDLACIGALSSVAGKLLAVLALLSVDLSRALTVVAYFVISVGYSIIMEWRWRGQTLGKKILRLRVVDVQGLRLHPSQIVVRNLLRFVDALPIFYAVGGMACLLNRKAQRLGDYAANTVVVRVPKLVEPDFDQVLGRRFNSLAELPHLAARLRQRVSPQEAGIALQAILRRDQLDPQARVELFGGLATHFRSLVAFPTEVTESLADEQYVRNVVDILFRTGSRRLC